MTEINYIGEHLLPGQVGHFCIVASFVASLLAAVAYFFATNRRTSYHYKNWLVIGRAGFLMHGAALATMVSVFFFILTKNYYEYHYVWANTSDDLPFEYIFSAFWKDQEGSFMLWLFWHVVLGVVLIWRAGKWEAPVMSVLSLVQFFIGSMILGIYVSGGDAPLKIGSNPFLLLRDVMDAPIFAKADYLSQISGNGLNPLLQNYWMTIHPPTLFLGFASTVVPFAYAVAGLWTREYKEWLKPALPWALFSGAILGTGILMGGAWAYEALTFGGYWAWDPVENMSLVPWLVLIAGIHTHLVAKATGHSLRATFLFYILTFLLILYSTFLTRSGILGDTSVHAFTELGLENQLVLFIGVFAFIGLFLLFKNYKSIPAPENEESTPSKEFWMFIGALVLMFSAAMITVSTSLPVFNKLVKIFDPGFVGRVINDPVDHYNRYQLWIALLIGLLSGGVQFLRFRESNWENMKTRFFKHAGIAAGISAALTALTMLWIHAYSIPFALLLFAAWFTIISNLDYVIVFMKNNWKAAGSAYAHLGFGLMIIGAMASGINKHHISKNELIMQDLLDEEHLAKNIILYKNLPMFMSGHEVTYTHDTLIGHERYYHVNFKKLDAAGKVSEEFTLKPNVLYDNNFTKVAAVNPSTKHYLHKDIFTHIASLPAAQISAEEAKAAEDSLKFETVEGKLHDTIFTQKHFIVIEGINRKPSHPDYEPAEGDMAVSLKLAIGRPDADTVFRTEPVIVLRGQLVYTFATQINELGVKARPKEEIFERLFQSEESMNFQKFTFKQGDKIDFNGLEITFAGFNKDVKHPAYFAKEGDVAVSAMMNVRKDTAVLLAEPVYLIRGNQPFNLKDEVQDLGLHFRFEGIDPINETVQMGIAQTDAGQLLIPLDLAENATRNDFIVLEAIVFPGINLFWLGSLLMMFGLGWSMLRRMVMR